MTNAKKVILFSTVIFAYCHCVHAQTSDGSLGPRFRLANGSVLEDETIIDVMYGTPVELFCTGQAHDLEVTRLDWSDVNVTSFLLPPDKKVLTTTLNQTTIRILDVKLERDGYSYYCTDTKRHNVVIVNVIVDSLPMVTNFHCITLERLYINCSWTTDNLLTYSSFYYVQDKTLFRLWNKKELPIAKYMNIKWDTEHPVIPYDDYSDTVTFLMKTCNIWGCENQRFEIDQNAVTKLGPVTELALSGKSSHSAGLRWFIPGDIFRGGFDVSLGEVSLDYRIIYMYYGIYQFQINKTRVKHTSRWVEVEIEIKLPCSDTFYEVRVSVKRHSAVGEEFWSDAAVISLVTDPEAENFDGAVDPTCQPREIEWTRDIMLYKIYLFRRELKEKRREIRENITALKLKRDKINLTQVLNE